MGFFEGYFTELAERLSDSSQESLVEAAELLAATRDQGRKVIVVGNGGSAAIAGHLAVDLTKAAGIRTVNFNEPSLLTCFSNDYGYERWVEKALEFYADEGDLLILISSSGDSANIVNGATKGLAMGLRVLTLSGFEPNNRLRAIGEPCLWVDSHSYNVVENVHQIWMLAIVDYLIANKLG